MKRSIERKKKETTPKSQQHDTVLLTTERMQYPLRTCAFLLYQALDCKSNHCCGSLVNAHISPGLDDFTCTFMSFRKTYQFCNFLCDSFTQGNSVVQFKWSSSNDTIPDRVPSPETAHKKKQARQRIFFFFFYI